MDDSIPSDHRACVEEILAKKLGLQPDSCTITQFAAAKNNHVYMLSLNHPVGESARIGTALQPLTTRIPVGTRRMILRIPKAASSVNDSVRIRNEVAFLKLGGQALASLETSLVPQVYGWKDDKIGLDWTLEEFKEGQVITQEEFRALDDVTKKAIMNQVANIVKLFQDMPLPHNLIHGGITFDNDGNLSSTEPVIPMNGPFKTYRDLIKGMCNWQLKASDSSPHLQGWRGIPGLRARIDDFFEKGLDTLLDAVVEDGPVLIHGDLSLPNILFDTSTYRITALLDFDFAHLAHPISEYLFSVFDFNGLLEGSAESNGPESVREAMLEGFSHDSTSDAVKLAHQWDMLLQQVGAKRVSEVPGAAIISDVWWFSQELCQFYWCMERWITRKSEEKLQETMAENAALLDKYLKSWNF